MGLYEGVGLSVEVYVWGFRGTMLAAEGWGFTSGSFAPIRIIHSLWKMQAGVFCVYLQRTILVQSNVRCSLSSETKD